MTLGLNSVNLYLVEFSKVIVNNLSLCFRSSLGVCG